MDEKLEILYKNIRDYYSNDVIESNTNERPDVILNGIAFEDTNLESPIIMLGYHIKYNNINMDFVSESSQEDIDAKLNYQYTIFIALHYSLQDSFYELEHVEGPEIMKRIENLSTESKINKQTIINDVGMEQSVEQYLDTMTYDIVNEFLEDADSLKISHLNIVEV